MTSQNDASLPDLIQPIYGIALSDELAVNLVTESSPQTLAAIKKLLNNTLASLIYVGGQRFIPSPQHQRIDPLFTAQWLLNRFPKSAALISTSPEVEHPFNYARRTLALDNFTRGRLGVVLGSSDVGSGFVTNGESVWSESSTETELVADFAHVLRRLWNSWPEASIISDKKRGIFADSSQIVEVNHNEHYKIRGPLNAPSSVQGEPLLGWHLTAPPLGNRYARDADLYISQNPPKTPSAPNETVYLVLRQLADVRATETSGMQHGTGTLLFLNDESEILEATAELETLRTWQTSEFIAPNQGTLRERLGLEARTLDVSGYTRAFVAPEPVGGRK